MQGQSGCINQEIARKMSSQLPSSLSSRTDGKQQDEMHCQI